VAFSAGTRLGAYEVVSLLGAGGMGEVYRAKDTRLGRYVAIKVLPEELTTDHRARARFESEARAVAALSHPGILALFDIGEEDGTAFAVTELLEGETLRERIGAGPLPIRRAVEIGIQVARALAAAHAQGVVHRDVKPENLFLTRDGHAKVLDFGIAKVAQPPAAAGASLRPTWTLRTEPGTVLGTLGYMAPEQARGAPADARSDVFALGATLHEALTGRPAFRGESAAEMLSAILRDEPADLAHERKEVPPPLARVIDRCLEKEPEERFQSARDVAFALEAALSGFVVAPGHASPGAASPRPRRLALALASVVAAFALGLGARTFLFRDRSPRFNTVTRLSTPRGLAFAPAISPDGKWVAYLETRGARTDVWVRFVAGGDPVNLTASAPIEPQSVAAIGGLAISPDGALVSFDARLHGAGAVAYESWCVPAPLGGVPRKLVAGGHAARWSPDGSRLVYVKAGSTLGDALTVSNADGSAERDILKAKPGLHAHWPAWSADARWIYYIACITGANQEPAELFRVAAASGGVPEPVVRTSRRALFAAPLSDGSGLLYSANPDGTELGLFFLPFGGGRPRRITVGAGEYAQPGISLDRRALVATHVEAATRLYSFPLNGEAPALLGDEASGNLDPAFSRDGTRLVFSSERSGFRNLWISDPDGAHPRPLTTGEALDERPAFSPDGRSVAFVSDRQGKRGIWLVPAGGGAPRLLVEASPLDALSFSRDGADIYYAAPGGAVSALFRVSVATSRVAMVPTLGGVTSPSASPVRDEIAILEPGESGGVPPTIRFVDPSGRIARPDVAARPVLNNGLVTWSPDGRWLAGYGQPGSAPVSSVYLIEPGAGDPVRTLAQLRPGSYARGICFTPDSSRVVAGARESTSEIVLFR